MVTATTRWLIQFGYDGAGFSGWARQPGARTVEGEIRRGVVKLGLVRSLGTAAISVASRTDRGVSARANALTLNSPLGGPALLRALNGIAPDIVFRAAAPIASAFDPRHATSRTYRYFAPARGHSLSAWKSNVALLTGRLDVRSFGREVPADRPLWRDVDHVSVRRKGRWMVLEIRARSFVWGMVRKIVATLRLLEEGDLTPAEVTAAVRGERRLTLPLAPPEPLVLWKVDYPIVWTYRSRSWARRQVAYLQREGERAQVRSFLMRELFR
ncbi:MAG: tRNA pseudouridine synthase A [Thermoplasmata archaeon]